MSTTTIESDKRRKLRQRVGGSLLGMGVLHVVAPKQFIAIIPDALPAKNAINLLAAVAEAGAGALLLSGDADKQRMGGLVATATVVGVYPGNINMAIKAGKPTSLAKALPWLRLPLQFPMLKATWSLSKPAS